MDSTSACWACAARVLAGVIRPGDLVLTAGAGDVAKVGPQVVQERWR